MSDYGRRLRARQQPITKLVTHINPDLDAWVCLWLAWRFIKAARQAVVVFVNAGSTLAGSEGDAAVLHFDTGMGIFDTHGESYQTSCSAQLVVNELELDQDPGLWPILEMVSTVDLALPIQVTSVANSIRGLTRHLRLSDGTPDWSKIQTRVFELLDILYEQVTESIKHRDFLSKTCWVKTLGNGLKVINLGHRGYLLQAAHEVAHVAFWSTLTKAGTLKFGVSARPGSGISLLPVAVWLRMAEAKERGIIVEPAQVAYPGKGDPVPQWYAHILPDRSYALVLNGSRKWDQTPLEQSVLREDQFIRIVLRGLEDVKIK